MTNPKYKTCSKCKRELPTGLFYKNTSKKDKLNTFCKECSNRYLNSWKKTSSGKTSSLIYTSKRLEKRRSPENTYYKDLYKKIKISCVARRAEIKQDVLKHYGNGIISCVRCGFGDIRALSLDHINENGSMERRELKGKGIRGGESFYKHLKDLGYPSGYQTLCYNCNVIKYREYLDSKK